MKGLGKVVWSKRLILFLCGAFLMVVLDFVSKWLVQNFVGVGDSNRITVIENFFYINKSYNTAVAFSLGAGLGVWGRVLNIAISLIMSFVIFWYWLTHDHKMKPIERVVALLLGAGAVGNLIDRAFYWQGTTGFDGVIDFFQFYLGGGPLKSVNFFNPFATFNIADAYLTIGLVLLLVLLIVDIFKSDRDMQKPPVIQVTEEKPQEIPTTSEENKTEEETEIPIQKEGE